MDVKTVLRAGYRRLTRFRKLPDHHHRAAWAVLACRTASMGAHRRVCPHGHVEELRFNSCRHRSCPRCGRRDSETWLDRQRDRLLPCDHFHVVFTLPSELRLLWRWNPKLSGDLMFEVSREVLFSLLADPDHLGAKPGVITALHTWGRTLVYHPHVHCLVTAGGITPDGQWKSCRRGLLLPLGVIRKVYRGCLLRRLEARLRAGAWKLPQGMHLCDALRLLRQSARKRWNVRIENPYEHGEGLAIYLARYLRGGPIGNSRLSAFDGDQVTFQYRDFRESKRQATLQLSVEEFTGRWLQHVPMPGHRVVRSYGLYHHALRESLESCRRHLEEHEGKKTPPRREKEPPSTCCCPECGAQLIVVERVPFSRLAQQMPADRAPPSEGFT